MNDIKVTVYLSTYNQEEYICEALDSILMQKTNFKYELLVADDCSTDKTQKIVLEYQEKYPEIIKTFFPNENLGGCKKLTECIDKGLFKGDYIAFLEGDDYWLNENRLQMLVDFLDENPEYSRVSHRRKVIDENGNDKGYDISGEVLGKPFYITDFLEGRQYSDFGSVFRNYFKEAKDKYHTLFWASRNVCDFQDMFITQDFGPVYVLDECLGVYRSRSVEGATNYNSITSQANRIKENLRLAKAVTDFYKGKYDLTPMIKNNKKRLVNEAVILRDGELFKNSKEYVTDADMFEIVPELLYLAKRGNRQEEIDFINSQFDSKTVSKLKRKMSVYAVKRMWNKLIGVKPNEKKRGTVRA